MQTKRIHRWTRPLTRQRLEIIRRNLDKTDADIARILGVSTQAVHFLRQWYQIKKVPATIQLKQRRLEQIRRLKPGLSVKAVAAQLGISTVTAKKYCRLAGYRYIAPSVARHFQWQQRIKSLPPQLTISAVARKLGLSYGFAALLCHRHKYKTTILKGLKPVRVPIRRWLHQPRRERWLASLKPPKP